MKRRSWRFSITGAFAAFVLYIPFLYLKTFDFESLGYMLLLLLLTIAFGIGIFVRRVFFKRWISHTTLLAVLFFLSISAWMFFSTTHLRPWARWLVASGKYTNLVLKQEPDTQTGLRWIEWDGWGWAGMDTSVELVYDPTDTLAHEIRHNPKGRFAEVAEKTQFVQRLGRGWYSLTLYTSETL
jgi:hypothetical protein